MKTNASRLKLRKDDTTLFIPAKVSCENDAKADKRQSNNTQCQPDLKQGRRPTHTLDNWTAEQYN
ncbi:MAG TPA: hypothetical protein VNZ64_26375 [Candidatus Acidoferrum sp.]|nr:hypothetical protein [Candidatus Acidoferrum sp.]